MRQKLASRQGLPMLGESRGNKNASDGVVTYMRKAGIFVWKVRLEGEYDIVTIEVNADSEEVLKWHSCDPLLIAYKRAQPIIDKLEAQEEEFAWKGCWNCYHFAYSADFPYFDVYKAANTLKKSPSWQIMRLS